MRIGAEIPSWNEYFFNLIDVLATRSKDPRTKVGCVIVSPSNEIRATGYNSLPRGVNDNRPERFLKPEKYLYVEHAERNAIYSAARAGVPLEGCSLYCNLLPCMECCRAVIQAGIKEVVVREETFSKYQSEKYTPEFDKVMELFGEAGVLVRLV